MCNDRNNNRIGFLLPGPGIRGNTSCFNSRRRMDLENNSPRLIEHHRGKGFTNNFRYSTKNNNSAGYAF